MENSELFNNLDEVNVQITQHCLDRYAERVMGRPIIGLEAENKAKDEIKKLYLSSDCYFTGVIGKSSNVVQVRCNKDGWIFIVDKDGKTLITVYKVDLMVDSDEVNQLYVEKALEKIDGLRDAYEQSITKALQEEETYKNELDKIDAQIVLYKKAIKDMESRRDAIRSLLGTNKNITEKAKLELRNSLEDFMVKDKFKLNDKACMA